MSCVNVSTVLIFWAPTGVLSMGFHACLWASKARRACALPMVAYKACLVYRLCLCFQRMMLGISIGVLPLWCAAFVNLSVCCLLSSSGVPSMDFHSLQRLWALCQCSPFVVCRVRRLVCLLSALIMVGTVYGLSKPAAPVRFAPVFCLCGEPDSPTWSVCCLLLSCGVLSMGFPRPHSLCAVCYCFATTALPVFLSCGS